MTGSISRKLYQQFLLLYPEPFRREFGNEMLSIFEECRAAQGFWRLLADVVFVAAKQQLRYFATPLPMRAQGNSEIAPYPKLAAILAITVFVVGVVAGGLMEQGKPNAAESWSVIHRERRFWFPTGIAVQGSNPDAPESWTVIRQGRQIWFPNCSTPPERLSKPQRVFSAHLGRERRLIVNELNAPR